MVEVAHEALLREWRELHEALLAEREFLVAKAQLEQEVAEWRVASEGPKSGNRLFRVRDWLISDFSAQQLLLSGNKLHRARDWLATRPQDLSLDERQFIKSSSDLESRNRRLRFAVLTISFISIIGFSFYAYMLSLRAERELKKAQTTQSLFLVDLARQQRAAGDAGTAMLLALEALPDEAAGIIRPYVPEAELNSTEHCALCTNECSGGHEGPVSSAAFSPDGKRIVTASEDKTARLWDAETGEPIGEPLKGHRGACLERGVQPRRQAHRHRV